MKMTMTKKQNKNNSDRDKIKECYKYIKVCLGCNKYYGLDKNTKKEGYCSNQCEWQAAMRLIHKLQASNLVHNNIIVRGYLANGKEKI